MDRVASAVRFVPFNWLILVTEERKAFYGDVETIARTSLAILAGAALLAVILLLFLANYLTKPIQRSSPPCRRSSSPTIFPNGSRWSTRTRSAVCRTPSTL